MARWQSGHAAACKAVYAGSIPTLASIAQSSKARLGGPFCLARLDPAGASLRAMHSQFASLSRGALPQREAGARIPALCPDGEIGRRKGLKIPHPHGYAGSTPAPGTIDDHAMSNPHISDVPGDHDAVSSAACTSAPAADSRMLTALLVEDVT